MDEYGESFPFDDYVEVIVLRVDNGRSIPVKGRTPVDLADGTTLTQGLLSELLDSTVRITAGEGNSSVVLDSLRAISVPPAFAASPWLAGYRPVVVQDGIGRVGDLPVRYCEDAGLRITDREMDHDLDDQDR